MSLFRTIGPGPIYEMENPNEPHDKILRSSKSTPAPDCNDSVPRAVPAPDIVVSCKRHGFKFMYIYLKHFVSFTTELYFKGNNIKKIKFEKICFVYV